MFFHIILTTECNSQCTYCFGEACNDMEEGFSSFAVDYTLPRTMSYKFDALNDFCRKDSDCILTFYGGEPLLCTESIKHIMNHVKARSFIVQTNGLLLNNLESSYVNRFRTILVSIDGEEALTDSYRGKGTFKKVVKNLKLIKRNGFQGEIVARMTVMEQTDIYQQVKWLVDNEEFSFSSIHWQLNAGFWKNDFERRDFINWSQNSYNPGIEKLAEFWVDQMEERGSVLKLYPFLGIVHSFLFGEKSNLLRCGGGWINYAIQTDGHIIPCPAMWGMKDYYLGHVSTDNPLNLKKVNVGLPCVKCDIYDLCGGRCLYAAITNRWNPEAYAYVCRTVKVLIETISSEIPRIRKLIKIGKVKLDNFKYMKYNGCEIIP